MGMGGSVCQWHAEEQIGFGYAMNALELAYWNARGDGLQREVLRCVLALKKESAAAAESGGDRVASAAAEGGDKGGNEGSAEVGNGTKI